MHAISRAQCAVAIPYRQDVYNLFPNATELTVKGKPWLSLRHDVDTTRILKNLGVDVPAPILSHYNWEGGSPFEIQKHTAAMLTMNRRAYVLSGMGTGKTKAAIWSFKYLKNTGMADTLLIVCPLSTINFTWARELFETASDLSIGILYGDKNKRLKVLQQQHDVYIINHDGLITIKDAIMAKFTQPGNKTCMVLDELAVYRNGAATRTKKTREVAEKMGWVWGMTGSPTPNAPTDVWAQARIVTPTNVPKYFTRFREELMQKVSQFRWVPKEDAIDKAFKVLQPSVRFTLDDVQELPDCVERQLDIPLGPKQERLYRSMKNSAFAAIEQEQITAMNAGAVLSKLLQISAGWVYSAGKGVVELDGGSRLQALVDTVLSADQKLIVFVPFKHVLNGVYQRLVDEGIDVAEPVSGDTPSKDRDEIFRVFQHTNKYRVLIAHPQCVAHGLTLTAASTIVWYAPTTSLEIFEQANARIRRIGQKSRQQILMFQSTDAEKRMYRNLREKRRVQNTLLDMFEEQTQQRAA